MAVNPTTGEVLVGRSWFKANLRHACDNWSEQQWKQIGGGVAYVVEHLLGIIKPEFKPQYW
jgi:hypothetical protein